jgi:transcriptional regulator with XRE-family HTH domain
MKNLRITSFSGMLPRDVAIERPFGEANTRRVGQLIRKVRRALGLTQQGLAELLGVTRPSIARWEAGGSSDERTIPTMIAFLRDRLVEDTVAAILGDSPEGGAATDALRLKLRPLAELYEHVLLLGGHACATARAWQDLLGFPKRFLDGVPPAITLDEDRFYWGFDVGLMLEAVLGGRVYSELVPTPEERAESIMPHLGATRLVSECELRWERVQLYLRHKQELLDAHGARGGAPAGE